MKNFIKKHENKIMEIIRKCGYEVNDVFLATSSRRDLGEYQYNGAMALAKVYKKNPEIIAEEIAKELSQCFEYENINVASPGFINISFSVKALIDYLKEIDKNLKENICEDKNRKIVIDYGGPNVAKTLHVGHLRSANIGEALKRLAKKQGCEVIADVHLGDWGRQMGLIILELKKKFPEWVYFDENFKGEYPQDCPVTNEELETIYPIASNKAKEDEKYLEEARIITAELQNKRAGYYALWEKIVEISVNDIKKIYEKLNISFDLWEGESDADKYMPELIEYLKTNNFVYESQGALVMDVSEQDDKITIPPVIIVKSNGAASYQATDLATLWGRMEKLKPDEVWYVVDQRQSLHFEQVFRAAKKSKIVPENVNLEFIGFGTMNGKDGKPFKTRDGGVMNLSNLIEVVKSETLKRLNENIIGEDRDEIADIIAVSALKYADFLPNRTTDYIFDPVKFSDMEGKTGVYLLYSTIRIHSLLKKANELGLDVGPVNLITNEYDKEVVLNLLRTPIILENAYNSKSLNEIAEYLYQLTNSYNNFYSANRILSENDNETRQSWLGLSENIYNANAELLDILGIEIPRKM